MANQENGFLDTLVDSQKQMLNNVVESTKKFTNGNNLVTETMEKGGEWYKNWLENQKTVFGKTAETATTAAETVKTNTNQANDFFQNWMNTQATWTKQLWDMNQNFMKNGQQTASYSNPMEQMNTTWNNWISQMNTINNGMNAMNTGVSNWNTWTNNMKDFASKNPFSMDAFKDAAGNANTIFTQWFEMLNTSFADWQKNLQNGTTQDAYRGMINTTEGFTRFYQMWMPMWKSIQEKTFNTEQFKSMMNPAAYKEFMDKFFGFMPESTRQYFHQLTDMMQNGAKQANTMGANGYQQMRQMMSNMPGINGGDIFGNMMSVYNNMHNMMQEAVSPIARMITPNAHTKKMMEWQDIANRLAIYSIKNAELQYMTYTQGTKVMDALADNVTTKIQNGEEVNSILSLYQEWMNISDKQFVSLFESDTYSQLMAEVSALQLKLRKDMETQMEGMMTGIPVATRTEMDELYKTIYDLKKEVRQLAKMIDVEGDEQPIVNTTFAAAPEEETPATTATIDGNAPKSTGSRGKKA